MNYTRVLRPLVLGALSIGVLSVLLGAQGRERVSAGTGTLYLGSYPHQITVVDEATETVVDTIIISGVGYSLLWPRSGKVPDDVVRVDWKPGAMVVPPNDWFHQHFNGGTEPARYLAFRWGSQKHGFSLGVAMEGEADVSEKLGGAQIEYEDEHEWIHDTFQETLTKAGAGSKMADFIPRLNK